MRFPPFLPLLLSAAALTSGCKTTPQKEKTDKPAAVNKKKQAPAIRDQSSDVAFQGFLSRLRQAVKNHDVNTLAEMMTADFGYRLEPLGEGAGVFAYWDQNNVWPELDLVLSEQFVANENYMVAPAEFLSQGSEYTGYRAGIRLENGSWKFAYFVSGRSE